MTHDPSPFAACSFHPKPQHNQTQHATHLYYKLQFWNVSQSSMQSRMGVNNLLDIIHFSIIPTSEQLSSAVHQAGNAARRCSNHHK